jgi:hypothetical protein
MRSVYNRAFIQPLSRAYVSIETDVHRAERERFRA